jgi:hypothetical protein
MIAFLVWGVYSYIKLVKKAEEREKWIQTEVIPEVADYLNNKLQIPSTISEDKMSVIVKTERSTIVITYERGNVFHVKADNHRDNWSFTMECKYYDVLCKILNKLMN